MSAIPQTAKLKTNSPIRIMPNIRPAPLRNVSSATRLTFRFTNCKPRAGSPILGHDRGAAHHREIARGGQGEGTEAVSGRKLENERHRGLFGRARIAHRSA